MTNASEMMDQRIKEMGDWRGKTLDEVRRIFREADPGIVEEWKWVKPTNPGVPVWSHNGGICTGETYKNSASLSDPTGLFNSSLDGKGAACHRYQGRRKGEREGPDEPRTRSRGTQSCKVNVSFKYSSLGSPTEVLYQSWIVGCPRSAAMGQSEILFVHTHC